MIIKLFLITFIVVNIIDISGIITSIKKLIGKLIHKNYMYINLPLIQCSYCCNWWLSLIYLYINNSITIPYIALVLIFSYITPYIQDLIRLQGDIIVKITNKIYNTFNL